MEKQNIKALSDKAFVRLISTSIIGILVCLICLCSSTYAWFSESIESPVSTIQTSTSCKLSVRVTGGEADALAEYGEALVLDLKKDVTYTVTLSLPSNSSSGYCVITANGTDYYSPYLRNPDNETESTVNFELMVAEDTSVTFLSHWGIYSGDTSVSDGILIIE